MEKAAVKSDTICVNLAWLSLEDGFPKKLAPLRPGKQVSWQGFVAKPTQPTASHNIPILIVLFRLICCIPSTPQKHYPIHPELL